jgi:hypothetical protein
VILLGIAGLVLLVAASAVVYAALFERGLLAVAMIAGCTLAGGFAGWLMRPPQWRPSLLQTAEMSANARKYGHTLEKQAEGVLLHAIFAGFLGTITSSAATFVLVALTSKRGLVR